MLPLQGASAAEQGAAWSVRMSVHRNLLQAAAECAAARSACIAVHHYLLQAGAKHAAAARSMCSSKCSRCKENV